MRHDGIIGMLLALGVGATQAQEGEATPAAAATQTLATIAVEERTGEAPAAPPPAAEDDAGTTLESIEVTAQRKVSTVQETPISIEAFSADKLQMRGINGLWSLAANVPSMTIEPFPTHNATLRMFIRGVGTADVQVTQDPAVGIYIDGVYIARSVGLAVDLTDLERIEVLRGPQGTLYGRNTTGGAINLITRRPSPGPFSMAHQLSYGGRNLTTAKSSFNLPLGDTLAAKFAVLGTRQDGFVDNTRQDGDFADRSQYAVRADLRWLAGDWLTADYAFDLTNMKYYNSQFQAVLPPNANHGLAEYFKPYAQQESVYSDQRLEALATGMPNEASRSRVFGHAMTLAAPLGDYGLKYIGAYRRLADDQYIDLGGGGGSLDYRLDTHYYEGPSADDLNGGPTPLVVPQVYQDQWTHELQFSGRLFEDSVEFVAGLFHFEESGGEYGSPVHHILNALVDPAQMAPLFAGVPGSEALFLSLLSPKMVVYWDYDLKIRNVAQAAFAQMTWTPPVLDRRLHLTAGVRKSRDRREADKDFVQTEYVEGRTAGGELVAIPIPPQALAGTDDFIDVHAEREDDDFSPSANLQYEISDSATTYLSYARAYKSGGFNIRDPQISGASGPASDGVNYGFGFVEGFRPEIVESVEVGLKSEWFGRRLRLNAALFDSDFSDMQTNFLVAGTIADTKARNVGKARMRGLELDTNLAAARGLVLGFNYSYLDADVLEVTDIDGNNVASLYPFVSAPPHSWVGSIDWSFLQRGWGTLRAYLAYHYIGDRMGTVIVEERRGLTTLHAFGIFNTRLAASGLRVGEHGSLELGLWGRNLADREYEIFAIDNLPHADRAVLWGEPRTFGLDLVYRYF